MLEDVRRDRPKEGDEGGRDASDERRWMGEVGSSCLSAPVVETGEVGASKASTLLRWKKGEDEDAPRGDDEDDVDAAGAGAGR